MKNTKRVISYIIVGVFVLIAAAILFLILSPSYEARIVRSESMKPALNMGDVVIMGPARDIGDIKPGMVLGFNRGEDMIAHRVVSVEGDDIQTAGDALGDPDPWLVPFSDVKGVYLFKVPYLGYVSRFARTPIGWGVLIILPGTLLMGYMLWDLFRKKEPKKAVLATVKARNINSGSSAKARGNSAGSSAKARVRRERRQRATSQ
ncbi:MAG: signal peptidase I [Dehalococcoidia bacterium]